MRNSFPKSSLGHWPGDLPVLCGPMHLCRVEKGGDQAHQGAGRPPTSLVDQFTGKLNANILKNRVNLYVMKRRYCLWL